MISFLHTAGVHVATFDAVLDELAPGMARQHRVEAGWLERARDEGLSSQLTETIAGAMAALAAGGVGVCTCSSIGAAPDAPVIRVDRALMETGLQHGARPLIAMCLESTRAATLNLLDDTALKANVPVEPKVLMCEGAWPHFEAGDVASYAEAIADAVERAMQDGRPDSIVLAQVSMASAEPLLTRHGLPVLSSPRPGVAKALKVLQAG